MKRKIIRLWGTLSVFVFVLGHKLLSYLFRRTSIAVETSPCLQSTTLKVLVWHTVFTNLGKALLQLVILSSILNSERIEGILIDSDVGRHVRSGSWDTVT